MSLLERLRFCEDCLRAGVPDEYFGWAGDQPAAGWQKIETALRDGTSVLLYSPMWEMTWGIQIGSFNGRVWVTGEGEVADNDPGFDPDAEVADDEDFDLDANTGPTHWMRLPTAPGAHP